MSKSSILSVLFCLGVCSLSSQVEFSGKNFDKSKGLKSEQPKSNHRELHGAIFCVPEGANHKEYQGK